MSNYSMPYIPDKWLWARWSAIHKHLQHNHTIRVVTNQIICNDKIVIAKNCAKFRPVGVLDWVHYTPKQLALAIDTADTELYYCIQLGSDKSSLNQWKRSAEEKQLKEYYAERAGRQI
jgi:hypothetical protein